MSDGTFARIESDGLLFGVGREDQYPVCEMQLAPGDRFILYTDGVTEAENAAGEAFGDGKFEQVIRANQSAAPVELTHRVLGELRSWQPRSVTQQDDLTLIVVDVL